MWVARPAVAFQGSTQRREEGDRLPGTLVQEREDADLAGDPGHLHDRGGVPGLVEHIGPREEQVRAEGQVERAIRERQQWECRRVVPALMRPPVGEERVERGGPKLTLPLRGVVPVIPAMTTPGTLSTSTAAFPLVGVIDGRPSPEHDSVRPLDHQGPMSVRDPLRKSRAEPVQPGPLRTRSQVSSETDPWRRSVTAGCRRRGSSRSRARRSPRAARGRPRRRAGRRSRGRPRGRRRGTRGAGDHAGHRQPAGPQVPAVRDREHQRRRRLVQQLAHREVGEGRPARAAATTAVAGAGCSSRRATRRHVDLLGVAGVPGLALDAVQLEEHRHRSTPRPVTDTDTRRMAVAG